MTCLKLETYVAVRGAAAADMHESENYKNLFLLRLVQDLLSIFIFLL